MQRALAALLALATLLSGATAGSQVSYVGGTIAGVAGHSKAEIDVRGPAALSLRISNKSQDKALSIAWNDVTTIEYGLHVDRRYLEAVLLSPLFLIAKKRAHFVTIGYTDSDGQHQAVVLEVGKSDIRQLLVSLEAKTGRKIEYQDDEARKAGKG